MPLFVAGVMVASVLSLGSCKKNQQQTAESVCNSMDAPIDEVYVEGERDGSYDCPYCGMHCPPGTEDHWHAFGVDLLPPGVYTGPTPTYPVWYCCEEGLSEYTCPYSGKLYDDPEMIQYIIDYYAEPEHGGLTLTWEEAKDRLRPRFHAHKIKYVLFGENGGQANSWHVGGGVPFWPFP